MRVGEELSKDIGEGVCGSPVSCHAGCGACCAQVVHAFWSEAVACVNEAERVGYKIPEQLLKDQLALISSGVDRPQYFAKHLKCVFLDEDDSCAIYNARPIACRSVLVMSEPEACGEDSGNVVRYDTRRDAFAAYQKIQKAQEQYGLDGRIGGPLQVLVAAITNTQPDAK